MIGRAEELSSVLVAASRARECGTATTVFISGVAGIGKTTLVHEVREFSREALWLGTRADEFDVGVPFSVVRALLGRISSLLEISPGEQRAIRDLIEPPTVNGSQLPERRDRFSHLAAAFARTIRNHPQPIILAFEDVHSADSQSLAFLPHLFRRLSDARVCSILTARPSRRSALGRLRDFATRAQEDGTGLSMRLRPFDRFETAEFAADVVGTPLTEAQAADLATLTGGVPFLIKRLLIGGAVAADGSLDLSTSASDHLSAIVLRAFPADGWTLTVAQWLAVLGSGSVTREMLIDLAPELGLEAVDVAEAVSDMITEELLELDPISGKLCFAHSLLRTAILAELGEAQRVAMHRSVADVYEKRLADGGSDDLIYDLAAHRDLAVLGGVDEEAATACTSAGDAAEPVAPSVAAEWFGRALARLERSDPRRLGLHRRIIYAHLATWSYGDAIDAAASADAEYGGTSHDATIGLSTALALMMAGEPATALARLQDSDDAPDLPADLHLMRSALEIVLRHSTHDRGGAAEICGQMEERPAPETYALPVEAGIAEICILSYAVQVGRMDIFKRHLPRALAAAHRSPEPSEIELIASAAYHDLLGPADCTASSRWLHDVQSANTGSVRSLAMHGPATATAWCLLSWVTGDMARARELAHDAVSQMRTTRARMLLGFVEALEAMACLELDRVREAEAICRRLRPRNPVDDVVADLARARLQRALGDHDGALALLRSRHDISRERGTIPFVALLAEELVDTLLAAGCPAEATRIAEQSVRVADSLEMPLQVVYAKRAQARATGDPQHARIAFALAESQGYRFEAHSSQMVMGVLDDRADENLTAAWHGFRECGAIASMRRAARELRARKFPVPRSRRTAFRHTGWQGLSQLDRQLARLAVQGIPNRQIAARTCLSLKTVEAYLRRIYRELGVANRIELMLRADDVMRDLPPSLEPDSR